MKLFITNKQIFEETIENPKEVHVKAFNKLRKSMEVDNSIPIVIIIDLGLSDVHFVFENKKEDVLYYSFLGTAN